MANKEPGNTIKNKTRAPIVTVMGHVDHGKTSILDAVRKTNVAGKEFGGITQHVGAYQIEHNSQLITFIDTPGHEAFTQMRVRGGKAADIVVLVVAADDGVMPQTKEAISHAKAAGVPIIVAINKVDLPGVDIQKIKQMLSQENVLVEDWGGDVVAVEVSAKEGKNIDALLDAILATAEILELKGFPEDELEATIVEARMDRKKGVLVNAIVRNGTLKLGMEVSASGILCKVKSLINDKGVNIKDAGPSVPVEILGFKKVPNVGDLIVEKGSDLEALALDEDRIEIVGQDTKKVVGIIVKADTQGTLEAIKASLAELVTSAATATFSLKFIRSATGDITDSDILLAATTRSVVVGFNVNVLGIVADLADSKKVIYRTYKTIYELVDDVEEMLESVAFDDEAKVKGRAEVLKLFKLPSGDNVVGCRVLAGALKVGKKVSIYAKDPDDVTKTDVPLYSGIIKRLKIKNDEVELVGKDNECGVFLKPLFNDVEPGYYLEMR